MAFEDILFLRRAEVIVGVRNPNTSSQVEPNLAKIFKTRINFEVEMDGSSTSNKAKINIYNLSQDSVKFLEQKNLVVFLKVGYDSTPFETLFFGDVDRSNGLHVKRVGPDVITTIEAGDAEKTLTESNINLGLSEGSTNIQIIEQAARKLLVSTSFKTDIPRIVYQNGFSYIGSTKKLLSRLGKQAGFEWSVQNGELIILKKKETDQQEAVFISELTGLIGFPVKTQDKVEFTSLINPRVRPGRAVQLESKIFGDDLAANLKVSKVTFKGDTRQGPWNSKVEGVIL